MLQGSYFYWVCWMIWTLLTFFHIFRYNRYAIICWLFLLMITLTSYINVFGYQLSISFILLLIGSTFIYVQTNITVRMIIISFTIMTAYIALRIWEIIAPVWFFIPAIIMTPLLISIGTIVLLNEFEHRIVQILFGISFGELFHSLILNGYYLSNEIVSPVFFDYLAMTVLFIVCIHIVRHIWLNIVQTFILLFNKKFLFKNE